jgi:hypothetical protein
MAALDGAAIQDERELLLERGKGAKLVLWELPGI